VNGYSTIRRHVNCKELGNLPTKGLVSNSLFRDSTVDGSRHRPQMHHWQKTSAPSRMHLSRNWHAAFNSPRALLLIACSTTPSIRQRRHCLIITPLLKCRSANSMAPTLWHNLCAQTSHHHPNARLFVLGLLQSETNGRSPGVQNPDRQSSSTTQPGVHFGPAKVQPAADLETAAPGTALPRRQLNSHNRECHAAYVDTHGSTMT